MSGSFAMPCHQVFILLCPLEYDFRERATALRSRNFQDRKTLFLNLSLFKVPWETGNTVRQGASDVCSQHVSVTPNATTCSRKIACILYTVSISRGIQDSLKTPNPLSPAQSDAYVMYTQDRTEYNRLVKEQSKKYPPPVWFDLIIRTRYSTIN